jgi:carbon-monoxide dehydrogenase medium subunit
MTINAHPELPVFDYIRPASLMDASRFLAEACRSVASYQLRSRATVVGNICNASPAGDTLGACLVLDGVLTIHGINGFRQVSLPGFFLGPGKTLLQPGDIVTSIYFPKPPATKAGVYLKLGRNTWSDLSIVGVTAYGFPEPELASGFRFRLALASVAPLPLLVPAVEDYLAAHPVTPEAIQQAGELAQAACSPIDDVRGSARYRKAMVKNLTEKALKIIWKQLEVRR